MLMVLMCMQDATGKGGNTAVCLQDVDDEVDDEVSSEEGDEDYEGGGWSITSSHHLQDMVPFSLIDRPCTLTAMQMPRDAANRAVPRRRAERRCRNLA